MNPLDFALEAAKWLAIIILAAFLLCVIGQFFNDLFGKD